MKGGSIAKDKNGDRPFSVMQDEICRTTICGRLGDGRGACRSNEATRWKRGQRSLRANNRITLNFRKYSAIKGIAGTKGVERLRRFRLSLNKKTLFSINLYKEEKPARKRFTFEETSFLL